MDSVRTLMIDSGREEERWRERARGREVRTGRQIDDEGGRKFKRETEKMKEREEERQSHGGKPQRKGGYKGTQYSWVKPSLL